MKYKTRIELVHELNGACFPIQCEELRINHPKSTSCSGNALHLLVLVVGRLCRGLRVMSSFSIWGWIFEGLF